MSTLETITRLCSHHLGVDADRITEKSGFIDDLGADSLDTIELVMAFEQEFELDIPDADADEILTVGDAAKYIDKRLVEA